MNNVLTAQKMLWTCGGEHKQIQMEKEKDVYVKEKGFADLSAEEMNEVDGGLFFTVVAAVVKVSFVAGYTSNRI